LGLGLGSISPGAKIEQCDRVLPTCNHCSWANRECKYTPLPTPAHRGIPRCDRCRFHNLKVSTFPLPSTLQYRLADPAIRSATTVPKTMVQSVIILQRSDIKYQRTTQSLSRIERQYPTPPKARRFWFPTWLTRRNILLAIGSRSIQKARKGNCPQISTKSNPLVPRIQITKTTTSMEISLYRNKERPLRTTSQSREPILR
jgi:hypothetical protein